MEAVGTLLYRTLRSTMGIFGMGQSTFRSSGAMKKAATNTPQAIYITAELKEPARQLPLAVNVSIPTIILCFIAANAAYYILLPWNLVSTTDSVAVVSSKSSKHERLLTF